MTTINKIEEKTFGTGYNTFEGFVITTDTEEITLGISDHQSCCEHYGYFMSHDNLDDFIGAKIKEIYLTDSLLDSHDYNGKEYSGEVIFVNIETNKGKLQFVAYNDHNGYYSHEVKITSTLLNHSDYI